MDMVGGSPVTKSIFRIDGGPASVPSFVADVGHEVGLFVNHQTERYASGRDVTFPLVAPEGGKEPLMAMMQGLDMGSDHDVFFDGSWAIPGIAVHEWPDRYIHTNFDVAANIDPTKLKRAAFIGAVTGWFLANMSEEDVPAVLSLLERNSIARTADLMETRSHLDAGDAEAVAAIQFEIERRKLRSINRFANLSREDEARLLEHIDRLASLLQSAEPVERQRSHDTVYVRNADLKGPMSAFGYSYAKDKLTPEKYGQLRLPKYKTDEGTGGEYVYEALNFVDGARTVDDIRDWLTAELGPVPVELVAEYLEALESIGVIQVQN